jgi:predicted ATPase
MDVRTPQYTETLEINNFLSIKKFNWVIKPFNIITGDMASGKSLCMKLLYFFEDIFLSSILLTPKFSRKLFEDRNFFDQLSETFIDFFYLKDNKWQNFYINYIFKANGSNFSISVTGDSSSEKQLVWNCDYLEDQLIKWSSYFMSPETPDMAQEVRIRIYADIRRDFLDKLPISTMFVPASRSALAVVGGKRVVGDKNGIIDTFLNDFAGNKRFLLSNFAIRLSKELADILHVKNIKKNPFNDDDVMLIHKDGRTVPSLFSSSGQQELVYLLLLMEKLPEISFTYGRMLSIFIEEPSAHLFPEEQKRLIERIVALFHQEKKLETRFFITTHSPYVLNVINNMLKKDRLIKKHPQYAVKIEENVKSPCLSVDDLSAYFIEEEGKNMIDPDKNIIFSDQIDKISEMIMKDRSYLDDLEDELV